jgi:RimJ/RimL family protein N-acetyltransferase
MPRLHGPNIMLREYHYDDLECINDFTQSPEITFNLSDIFTVPQTLEQSKTFLDSVMAGNSNGIYYVIADLEGNYLGQVDLMAIDWSRGIGTLGIVLAKPIHLNKGIGREAISLLLHHCFGRMGLRKIELSVYSFNQRGQRCYQACGFIQEGTRRGHALRDGVWHDAILMGVFSHEFYDSPAWKQIDLHVNKSRQT